jgi:hypothetical protein
MNETAHSDCAACDYWQARISEEKARIIAGCDGAFDREKIARMALAAHREHTGHVEGDR